jgi:hypothetical protein
MVACGLEYLLAFGGRAATNLNDIALFDISAYNSFDVIYY